MIDDAIVAPALTPEEWERKRVEPISADKIVIHDDGDGLELVEYLGPVSREARVAVVCKHKIAFWDTHALHAIAALALHGQAFGFTREDVVLLRESGRSHWSPRRGNELLALADRIQALLPPERT